MEEATIDFDVLYRCERVQGFDMLVVHMSTKEFGLLVSSYVKATDDDNINRQLHDSLADNLIDEYIDRLKHAGLKLPKPTN